MQFSNESTSTLILKMLLVLLVTKFLEKIESLIWTFYKLPSIVSKPAALSNELESY